MCRASKDYVLGNTSAGGVCINDVIMHVVRVLACVCLCLIDSECVHVCLRLCECVQVKA